MEPKGFRNYTRFIILTFFLASNAVFVFQRLFLSFRHVGFFPVPSISTGGLILISFSILFWYAVEIVDFFKWNYSKTGRLSTGLLFTVRIVPFAVTALVMPAYMPILFPVFFLVSAFYFSVYFKTVPGLSFLIILLAAQLAGELFLTDPFRPPGMSRNPDAIFIIYKLMTTILAWLIGFFWKQDRVRWQQIRRLNGELKRTHNQLREYAEKVADTVILEERNRLAMDIHDSLGHNLTAASIQLNKAEAYFRREADTALEAMKESRNCIQEGIRDVRELVSTLNEGKSGFDVFEHCRKLLDRFPDDKFKISVQMEGKQQGYNKAVLLAIYRLVQEGLTNIMRHSDARNIIIEILLGSEQANVRVSDDGKGFDAATVFIAENSGGHFGLRGLKNRIELVRGLLEVKSEQGKGTTIECMLPKNPMPKFGEISNE